MEEIKDIMFVVISKKLMKKLQKDKQFVDEQNQLREKYGFKLLKYEGGD